MATRTKAARRPKRAGRGSVKAGQVSKAGPRLKKGTPFAKPYDAKKYAGSVPAFASVMAEEMRKWRDDR